MSAVCIPLIWEKVWFIWPDVAVHCFLLRQVNQLLWLELDVILKSNGNSLLSKYCLFEQITNILILLQKKLESSHCIYWQSFVLFFFFVISCGLLQFVQVFRDSFIGGPLRGRFWGADFQEGGCSACLAARPMYIPLVDCRQLQCVAPEKQLRVMPVTQHQVPAPCRFLPYQKRNVHC